MTKEAFHYHWPHFGIFLIWLFLNNFDQNLKSQIDERSCLSANFVFSVTFFSSISGAGTSSPVMSLRSKSRSRCVDRVEIRGVQVGFRAPLLTVYLLQGGGDSKQATQTLE